MADTVRVHQLAVELGVTSRGVLGCLARHSEFVKSASSVLGVAQVQLVRAHLDEYERTTGGRDDSGQSIRRLPPPTPSSSVADDAERAGVVVPRRPAAPKQPQQLTALEAQRLVDVKAVAIRQWVSRGYLERVGQRGRSALYDRTTLLAVRDAVRARTPRPPPEPALYLPPKYDERLVTAAEAAILAGVSASTVRSWVSRGHLTPTARARRPHLFAVGAVLDVPRRLRRGRP